MPFIEFGSDKRFYVQFPVSSNPSFERFGLASVHDISAPEGCINLEMAGERVNVQLPTTAEDSRSITNSTQVLYGDDPVPGSLFEVKTGSTLYSSAKIIIRVGETRLSVFVRASVTEQYDKTRGDQHDSTPYDFTDNYDYNKMIDGTTTQAVDDLLDYVTIGTF
jgi:hypothetical protein